MKKFVCLVCGYVYEGESAPDECPICHAPASKFAEQAAEKTWAAEHVVGIAKGVDQRIIDGLRENFNGECTEVGMYLAMARVAHREGYPEIGLYWEKAAFEEAEHAAKFAELLGEVVTDSTDQNLWLPSLFFYLNFVFPNCRIIFLPSRIPFSAFPKYRLLNGIFPTSFQRFRHSAGC